MNPNPFLQYRHALGLGDFVACTLHSKYINPLTIAITGKDGLCASCDARRQALNLICPVPFWKLFYKDSEERDKNIESYLTYKDKDNIEIPWSEYKKQEEQVNLENKENFQKNNIEIEDVPSVKKNVPDYDVVENYRFLNSSDVELDNYIVRTTVYKKI
jgi:hypothetical protein